MRKHVEYPYLALGQKLKEARLRLKRTVAEASGAIEVNEDTLKKIEQGAKLPAEDTLEVLISYLEFKDEEASQIWSLAGYHEHDYNPMFDLPQPITMVIPSDPRVVYTDMVHVMINDFGVVMNFMQGAAPGTQPLAVARIGMSKEHAKSVIEILQKSLQQSEQHSDQRGKPKMLPSSKPDNKA